MKVCFVYPDIAGIERYGARKYYHGLGYLSSVLKQAGHTTELVYLEREPLESEFLQRIGSAAPQLVAFSATTHQFPHALRCARWIKQAMPGLLTLAGGIHPTLAPEDALTHSELDLVCVGEGEQALLDLVTAMQEGRSYENIAGLWRCQDGGVAKTPLRPLVAELDELPFADRELFHFEDILAKNGGWVDLMAGRGCPYSCTYCSNPALRERFHGLGRYVRFRSVDNVLAEIRDLAKHYDIQTLNFQDDVFTLDRNWVLQFCSAYGAEFTFPFWINSRVERVNDEEMVAALARARCRGVRIGLESGNEELRAQVLQRRMSNDEIRRVFALAREYGLDVYTCNMLGVPGETVEMIEETIALNRELVPAGMQFSVFYPYPMTALHDLCVRNGYISEEAELNSYYDRKSVLRLPTLSEQELEKEYDRFEQLKVELQMKRHSPLKYRAYQLLRLLLGGDSRAARSALRRLVRIVEAAGRLVRRSHDASPPTVQVVE